MEDRLEQAGCALEEARTEVNAEAERMRVAAAKELAAEQQKAEQKAEKVAQRTAQHMEKLQEERRALEGRLAQAEAGKMVRCGRALSGVACAGVRSRMWGIHHAYPSLPPTHGFSLLPFLPIGRPGGVGGGAAPDAGQAG